jgi:peptidoglycan/xylan/chitin deacetylase (PgdA/CDA1 family)
MKSLRRILLRAFTAFGMTAPFRHLTRGHATVFMLHRFRDDERGNGGCAPEVLRRTLEYLRREKYRIVSLDDLFQGLQGQGSRLERTVAFTIDDGYFEQASVASPIFAEYDCPVTTFVTTGFLDGEIWFWWDKIEYCFQHTRLSDVELELAGVSLKYDWKDEADRRRAMSDFRARCKSVPDDDKLGAIELLAARLEVDLPELAPLKYAPMTWDQLRECEGRGMSFGPHTVSHPILSRTSDQRSRREITESWERLRSEAAAPVAVFCYPNGKWDGFGDREIAVLEELNFTGAVAAVPGYASARTVQSDPAARFKVRRFSLPNDTVHMIQYVSGVERFKQLLRRET